MSQWILGQGRAPDFPTPPPGPREVLMTEPAFPWGWILAIGVVLAITGIVWLVTRRSSTSPSARLLIALAAGAFAGLLATQLADPFGPSLSLVFIGLQLGFVVFIIWALLRVIRGLDTLTAEVRKLNSGGPPPPEGP